VLRYVDHRIDTQSLAKGQLVRWQVLQRSAAVMSWVSPPHYRHGRALSRPSTPDSEKKSDAVTGMSAAAALSVLAAVATAQFLAAAVIPVRLIVAA